MFHCVQLRPRAAGYCDPLMTYDLKRHGFVLERSRPLTACMTLSRPAVAPDAALLLQRQRHLAFILTLAHELRQPLSALFGAIHLLQETTCPAPVARALEIIDRQANHMNRMVDDLIESARWSRGTTLLRLQRLDLRTRLDEALSDARQATASRQQLLVLSAMPEPLWVDADPARLRQVLSNLLDNAIKFTQPGGCIHLSADQCGREIVVRIKDSGRGMRPDEIAHIFDLFSQVRPIEGRGLGIGLNVAWEIVALHKGHIGVRSDGPSLGSEFTVTLPSAADQH